MPQTETGADAWEVLRRCGRQVRIGQKGHVYGLDFSAVLMLAQSMGADASLLAEVLGTVEAIIVNAYRESSDDSD